MHECTVIDREQRMPRQIFPKSKEILLAIFGHRVSVTLYLYLGHHFIHDFAIHSSLLSINSSSGMSVST